MKILGILILTVGALVFLVGLGGALANFVFLPKQATCKSADQKMIEAEKALKVYEAAKGTPDELARKADADQAIKSAGTWNDACASSMASARSYGLIFSGVGVVGGLVFLVGTGIAFLGFRKKKLA